MKVLVLRNIGKQEKILPPLKEGHVYDVDEEVAKELFNRNLAEVPPPDAPKAEKAPPHVASATPVVDTGPKPLDTNIKATPTPAQMNKVVVPEEDYDAWTGEELHQEAAKRDIQGRGSMNKGDLAKALKADDKKKR